MKMVIEIIRTPTRSLIYALGVLAITVCGAARAADKVDFQVVPGFFKLPDGWVLGGCSAVATNSKSEIYLFHRGAHPIICFDAGGNFLRSFGDDVIEMAHGLRVDRDDNVWVTDIGGHRVYQFDPAGKVLKSLGTGRPGAGSHQFNRPTDIAFGPDGEFYVSDGYGNNRVAKFSPSGAFVKAWGTRGKGRGQFNLPHSIVMDSQHRLFVGDRENNRIHIFDREGKLQDTWNGYAPYGLALGRGGELFVADGRANKVLLLDTTGKVVGSWGGEGTAPGEFKMPHMLTIDSMGDLLVAEVDGMRLQKFGRK